MHACVRALLVSMFNVSLNPECQTPSANQHVQMKHTSLLTAWFSRQLRIIPLVEPSFPTKWQGPSPPKAQTNNNDKLFMASDRLQKT